MSDGKCLAAYYLTSKYMTSLMYVIKIIGTAQKQNARKVAYLEQAKQGCVNETSKCSVKNDNS